MKELRNLTRYLLTRPHRIGCRYYIKQQYKGVFEKQKIKRDYTIKCGLGARFGYERVSEHSNRRD
ncbi:hypothetical protein EUBHAL_00037 [Anaerobutyricum hallii DSM 3353]|uniref:Uncharacterized protein n=1 Tax=Anaerobutyricum hallii DSM 3353 TaxID=411469 RepID=C0ERN0_9FIRM|nr:hypothetical protein EUBHAL_00037 [Anaerobutyricum hallii DSM 3353]